MDPSARPENPPEIHPSEIRFKVAARVSEAFRKLGFEPIQYGGATVEQYTRGAYATGDVDIGFLDNAPSLAERNAVMQALGSPPALRLFVVDGVVVDLGGVAEILCRNFVRVSSPDGNLLLEAPEGAIIQRLLMAVYPAPNADMRQAARLLMAQALAGNIPVDWAELTRLAALPIFRLESELETLRRECAGA